MVAPAPRFDALIVGAGPAGLMAAEELSANGARVCVLEAKPSAGRKLLMAGKSGLNLTKDEDLARFYAAYGDAAPALAPMLAAFGPDAVRTWAEGLGVPLFTGTTGRVFPVAMKASPLLRAWLARLRGRGVELRMRWRWRGFAEAAGSGVRLVFATPEGAQSLDARIAILALGGGSWTRLGSDGTWVPLLAAKGVAVTPFQPANMGFSMAWSAPMARHFGVAVKGVALRAGGATSRGEFVVSSRGLEGGGIYALSRVLRAGAALYLDLAPDLDAAALAGRLARGKNESLVNRLRKGARLSPVQIALAQEFARPLPREATALAAVLKVLPVPLGPARPLDEAISTAGGIAWSALNADLQLRALPGVFAAGEMLDWEAPTGGYLLTACLATGHWAGRGALAHLR